MADKPINIFSKPEEIDAFINARLKSFPAKSGKCNSKTAAWTEDELSLRDQVIMSYITENCMSKEKTAQQLIGRWNISIQTARQYVKDAIERFSKNYVEDNSERQRQIWMEKCESILQDCIDSGDKSSALKAMDLLGKSMGIYREKTDVNLSGGADIKFDFQ